MKNDIYALAKELESKIKVQPWMPYKTGNLKFNAFYSQKLDKETSRLTFDTTIAPYIPYLELGTQPHDIPMAFGNPLPFGIGGRFNGKFHPGSTKHKGFISNKAVMFCVNYICSKYNGQLGQGD